MPAFNERSIRFMTKLLARSGLGDETCLPPAHHYIPTHKYCTLDATRNEVDLVVFSTLDDQFAKMGIRPDTIDIVVVNYNLFYPTPSFIYI